MSHQYVDKTELKTFLGMSGSGQDNNLDFALDAASAAIDDFCGRVFYAIPLLLRIVIMTVSLLILLMLMI